MDNMKLISGGTFQMGSNAGYSEEKPVHKVTLEDFYIDICPVTNAEYKEYCDATGRPYPAQPSWNGMPEYFLNYPDYPVVNVSWSDASAYAAWSGKRLPTEEEWEYAAAGGISGSYSWGEEAPNGALANYADKNCEFSWKDFAQNDGYAYTSPVGHYPPNPYGLYDMSGNVYEWTSDWFFLYSDTIHDTEKFKDGWGGYRVCRGGCYHSPAGDLRISRRRRILGGGPNSSVGFRCVKDVRPGKQTQAAETKAVEKNDAAEPIIPNIKLPDGQELCVGMSEVTSPRSLAEHKTQGYTSVEQYVTWESCERTKEGGWDFSHWDKEYDKIRAAGLKWLPFIIAGPAYSLPKWYRESREFEGFCCLEHGIESKIQTFYDHNFYNYIDRFLKSFSEHFQNREGFEGILLGICGDFGESIMSVWHGNWPTAIPGLYHAHPGYWCGDRFARADFKKKMQERFDTIEALNTAWGTEFSSFEAVEYPPIVSAPENFRVDEETAPGVYYPENAFQRRRWIDFIDWYRGSMTEYVSFWMHTARKYFPDQQIYLCTGGDAVPWHGSEFAQQCKACAEVGGGVRITNEASDYTLNFAVTNWVASAGSHYNTYYSFEPAGQVTERGVVCRIYNAAATGAKSLHYYGAQTLSNQLRVDNFTNNIEVFQPGKAVREIALLYPDTPMVLDTSRYLEMFHAFRQMRDYTDYVFACDVTIRDGILNTVKALIITMDGYYRAETLKAIRNFVDNGGLLIGVGLKELRDLEEELDYMSILFHRSNTLLIPSSFTGTRFDVQTRICDIMTNFFEANGVNISDGVLDEVYTARKCCNDGEQLLIMNYSGADVQKRITLPDGSITEIGISDSNIVAL